MPFTHPLMLGASKVTYPAQISFEPDPGTGTGAATVYNSTITLIQDVENYFGDIDGDVNYDYIEFSTFGTYEFAVIANTLSGSNVSNINLVEIAAEGPSATFTDQTIFTVYTSADGALFPQTTKTISDTASYVDALANRISRGGGGASLTGTFTIGVKKTS